MAFDFPAILPFRLAASHVRGGLVRGDGQHWRDDGGRWFPLGTSLFWGPWGWKYDRDRVRENLAYVAAHGLDYTRALCEIGGTSWEDRAFGIADDDFVDVLEGYLDVSYGEFGVRVLLTIFGSRGPDPRRTVDGVLRAIADRHEAVQYIELANEAAANFPDRALLRDLVRVVRQQFGGVVASSSPADAPSAEACDLDVANGFTMHPERTRADEDWRQVRQGVDAMGVTALYPGDDQEPPGLESSVATLDDPLRLSCLRMVGIVSGMSSFVIHTGAGIRGGGAADRAIGRKSNVWEYGDRFDAIVNAMQAGVVNVPIDAPGWRKMKGHWVESTLRADVVWSDDPARFDHGCVRLYGAYTDSQFVHICFGVRRYVDLTVQHGPWSIVAFDALTGVQAFARDARDGETFRLAGDPTGGSNKAYVVLGERR